MSRFFSLIIQSHFPPIDAVLENMLDSAQTKCEMKGSEYKELGDNEEIHIGDEDDFNWPEYIFLCNLDRQLLLFWGCTCAYCPGSLLNLLYCLLKIKSNKIATNPLN